MKDFRLQAIASDPRKRFFCGQSRSASASADDAAVVFATKSLVPLGWPLSDAGWAALTLAVNSAICDGPYICLVNHAGKVFGSQTANVVTHP